MGLNIQFHVCGTAYVELSGVGGMADVTYTMVCEIHLRLRHCSATHYTVKNSPCHEECIA